MRRATCLAGLVALFATSAACNKVQPQLPVASAVFMETPPPPPRLHFPVELPEPAAPAPETPEPPAPAPTPPPQNPVVATRPVERPPATAPAEAPPAPVLRTTTDTPAAERRIAQLIESAEQDLNKVSYRELNSNARTQYDSARTLIRMAASALKVKNYTYADFLAARAASLAGLLVKG